MCDFVKTWNSVYNSPFYYYNFYLLEGGCQVNRRQITELCVVIFVWCSLAIFTFNAMAHQPRRLLPTCSTLMFSLCVFLVVLPPHYSTKCIFILRLILIKMNSSTLYLIPGFNFYHLSFGVKTSHIDFQFIPRRVFRV